MDEYEREDGVFPSIDGSDGSESGDGGEQDMGEDRFRKEKNHVDTSDGESEGNPGSGYESGGSSVDDDEDSKLRALLHQVGRTYVGYAQTKASKLEGQSIHGTKSKAVSSQHQLKSGHKAKELLGLNQNTGNTGNIAPNSDITAKIEGVLFPAPPASKSTVVGREVSGSGLAVAERNENIKPSDIS